MTNHEKRELTFRLGQARKQHGQQGRTIHLLRCEIAELHSLISKSDRGVFRRIQADYEELYATHQQALEENRRLREKLDLKEKLAGSEA